MERYIPAGTFVRVYTESGVPEDLGSSDGMVSLLSSNLGLSHVMGDQVIALLQVPPKAEHFLLPA